MPLGLASHFAIETTDSGMPRNFFCLGGERLNFPEFTWSVRYSIVQLLMFYKIAVRYTHEGNTNFGITDHYGGRESKYGYHLLYSILSMY